MKILTEKKLAYFDLADIFLYATAELQRICNCLLPKNPKQAKKVIQGIAEITDRLEFWTFIDSPTLLGNYLISNQGKCYFLDEQRLLYQWAKPAPDHYVLPCVNPKTEAVELKEVPTQRLIFFQFGEAVTEADKKKFFDVPLLLKPGAKKNSFVCSDLYLPKRKRGKKKQLPPIKLSKGIKFADPSDREFLLNGMPIRSDLRKMIFGILTSNPEETWTRLKYPQTSCHLISDRGSCLSLATAKLKMPRVNARGQFRLTFALRNPKTKKKTNLGGSVAKLVFISFNKIPIRVSEVCQNYKVLAIDGAKDNFNLEELVLVKSPSKETQISLNQVRKIRASLASFSGKELTEKVKAIALEYGFDYQKIQDINKHRLWKEIPCQRLNPCFSLLNSVKFLYPSDREFFLENMPDSEEKRLEFAQLLSSIPGETWTRVRFPQGTSRHLVSDLGRCLSVITPRFLSFRYYSSTYNYGLTFVDPETKKCFSRSCSGQRLVMFSFKDIPQEIISNPDQYRVVPRDGDKKNFKLKDLRIVQAIPHKSPLSLDIVREIRFQFAQLAGASSDEITAKIKAFSEQYRAKYSEIRDIKEDAAWIETNY
ncbi:hypothetical protein Xen7305DRAFT_00008400 [Xenococcus sp. PCC 7305]|uniref:hypothetical protein n=1 Tax=Xenococcus sp. PCC 7305 TaxID=102125 RepID=UPI0002ABF96A|nr:hypothetical protein [Xenococcus sp. PCC 7305]ELS01138.1 hypothetical protein Xen7305DRAFT_00008400 [Xenococcus sp. PCC 7305]